MAQYMCLQGAFYEPSRLRKDYGSHIAKLRTTPETEVDLAVVIRRLYTNRSITPAPEAIAHWAMIFRTLSLGYVRLFDGAAELLQELHRRGKKSTCSPTPSVCSRNRKYVLWASINCLTISFSPPISAFASPPQTFIPHCLKSTG